jgi:nucleoside-diphosphate-sugar epimerase
VIGTDWRGRRVLVTGARGFIASHLCRQLLQEGALVFGISRRPNPAGDSSIRWSQKDLTDAAGVRAVIAETGPDVVFHLAGHVTGSQRIEEVHPTLAMNLVSTVNLLTAVAGLPDCRVVLAGSMQEPTSASGIPPSPYAASKWACSAYARMFHALYRVPVIVARPFMVYGPGQWDLSKLLPYVIVSLLKGEVPRVSSGARELDWVFVADVVTGLMRMAMSPAMDASTIDLGSGRLVSIRDVIEQVTCLIGGAITAQFGAVADRTWERPRVAQIERTRQRLGWGPTVSLAAGLSQTVEWYRAQVAAGVLAS